MGGMVDPGMGRLKGFELFRLHLALFDKVKALSTNRRSLTPGQMEKLVQDMQNSLMEAKLLLEDDISAPGELFSSYSILKKALEEENVFEELQCRLYEKYTL